MIENPSSKEVISLVNVNKTYFMGENQVHALQNVSFSIKEGELVSIMGPSGSGKSTCMNMIGCLDRPTSGQVFIDGKGTFEMAWKIARPNAIVALVAMYEEAQKLPLPDMYGKNLIFKTGGVDANHSELLLKYISEGKINTDFLITHEFSIDDIERAYKFFESRENNCIKVAIKYF